VGIVGCGRVVTEAYVGALAHIDQFRLTATVDLSLERAQRVAYAFRGGGQVIVDTDIGGLQPDNVDLVLLALPPAPAVVVARQLLMRGVSVLAEKPFTLDVAILEELESIAIEIGAWFGIVTNYIHRPDLALAVSTVAIGALGQPVWIRLHTPDASHWLGSQGFDPDWRIKPEVLGGGVGADKGYHLLYLSEALAGAPIRDCQWRALRGHGGCVHTWVAQAGHTNGVVSSLLASWESRGEAPNIFEVHGTEGSLYIDPTMHDPLVLALRTGDTSDLAYPQTDPWGYGAQFREVARILTERCLPNLSGPKRWAFLLSLTTKSHLPSFGTAIVT
jgi:predicted dehydrogenase